VTGGIWWEARNGMWMVCTCFHRSPTDSESTKIDLNASQTQPAIIMPATEIIFLVEEDAEGGYTAQALNESIFTEAEDLETLKIAVKDAINCHFDTSEQRMNF
jgi:hypothetical protein